MKASARIKEKRLGRFSPPDFKDDSEQRSFAVFQKLKFLESFLDLLCDV